MNAAAKLRQIADELHLERTAQYGGRTGRPTGGTATNGAAHWGAGYPVHFVGDDPLADLFAPSSSSVDTPYPITSSNGFANGHMGDAGAASGKAHSVGAAAVAAGGSETGDRLEYSDGLRGGSVALAGLAAMAFLKRNWRDACWCVAAVVISTPVFLGWMN